MPAKRARRWPYPRAANADHTGQIRTPRQEAFERLGHGGNRSPTISAENGSRTIGMTCGDSLRRYIRREKRPARADIHDQGPDAIFRKNGTQIGQLSGFRVRRSKKIDMRGHGPRHLHSGKGGDVFEESHT